MEIINPCPRAVHPRGAVLALGFFDGIHLGHRALFDEARRLAAEVSADVGGLTIDRPPRGGECLTTEAEKARLFTICGAAWAAADRFEDIRALDGHTFFAQLIAGRFAPAAVVCGFNFTFGAGASCHADDLERFAREAGIPCSVCPAVEIGGLPVSSTRVRTLVRDGAMEEAARLLGGPYSFDLPVVHGLRLGHAIGHPTLNQRPPAEKLLPPRGVYASLVTADGKVYRGVSNLGSRPTVNADAEDVTLETTVFGDPGELYGRTVSVGLASFLRPERAFSSLAALEEQIGRDAEDARRFFDHH